MVPRFNLGLLSPGSGSWGQTAAGMGGQMPQMPQMGGLLGQINPAPSFQRYGNISPSDIMGQIGIGGGGDGIGGAMVPNPFITPQNKGAVNHLQGLGIKTDYNNPYMIQRQLLDHASKVPPHLRTVGQQIALASG